MAGDSELCLDACVELDSTCDSKSTTATDADVLSRWDVDIVRAARKHVARIGDAGVEDAAQAARLRLLKVARRADFDLPEGYLRVVVSNAVRGAVRVESMAQATACLDDEIANEIPDDRAVPKPSGVHAVARWVMQLPAKLQVVFDLLYRQGLTQREAAAVLEVTQPRIAQLHKALVARGRADLAALAA